MERLTEKVRNEDGSGICKLDITTVDDSLTMAGRNVLTKLADYKDMEERGLLVKLPCKIGDTVFIIVGKCYSRQRVKEIRMFDNRIECITSRRTFSAHAFGIDVFPTREAAEMELKNRWEK